jgi:hypothetical protein
MLERLAQLENAYSPMDVTKGKLTLTILEQYSKALEAIVVAFGKLIFVRAEA